MSATLYVGNIPYGASEESVRELLAPFAPREIRFITDRATGAFRGFAFAYFRTEAEANAAIAGLQNATLDGRRLRITEAEDRRG